MYIIIIILILLLFSAFFSSAETAYFNVKKHRDNIPENVKYLLENPRSLLVSLLTGNTIINITKIYVTTIVLNNRAMNLTDTKNTIY